VPRWSHWEKSRALGIAFVPLALLTQCESKELTLGRNPTTVAHSGGSPSTTLVTSTNGGETSINAGGTSGASSAFTEPRYKDAELVTELAASDDSINDENPTLTSNLLEIYFTSSRDGGTGSDDVWMAQRAKDTDAFATPVPVESVNTKGSESSPAIATDGSILWLGVELDGGVGGRDIWRFERTGTEPIFGKPILEPNINSSEDDIPRPLGNGQLTMPLASRRGDTKYTTYLATRSSTTADFETPSRLEELVVENMKLTDAFLTNDGLDIYFVRAVDDTNGDLYVAHRETVTSPFGHLIALSTLNTDKDERDPFLSPDGRVIYFVSDRDGPKRIYRASRDE
jgi:hypothetical protein